MCSICFRESIYGLRFVIVLNTAFKPSEHALINSVKIHRARGLLRMRERRREQERITGFQLKKNFFPPRIRLDTTVLALQMFESKNSENNSESGSRYVVL